MSEEASAARGSVLEIVTVMARLGCIAFGGPVAHAHLAHFQRELIDKRKWIEPDEFTDLIAFCQFLPGPASSQVGMCLGLRRGGLLGMFAAWFAFTMPSVLLLLAAAGIGAVSGGLMGWLHGLLAAVVAIVADAVLKLGRKCCRDPQRISLAVIAAVIMLLAPRSWVQLLIIAGGGLAGLLVLPKPDADTGVSAKGLHNHAHWVGHPGGARGSAYPCCDRAGRSGSESSPSLRSLRPNWCIGVWRRTCGAADAANRSGWPRLAQQ
ncbi:MAG: chromate transporter [Planctomycetota bacterium]|jgi:chromate transport protein ChrA|nr:chromate transporter [Planctomycetota bacterium]